MSNLTTNHPFQTSIIISGYKVPLTKIIIAVLFGISDVNSDIFEGPWPYEKQTRTRTNSSLQVETKDTSLGTHIHDGQSSELFGLGLLRIHSSQVTRCHRSTPYTLSTISMTSEGEHEILLSFGLLTGTPFMSESGLLRIYSLRYLYT